MYPVYLLEDNEIQRQKYAEFIKNGILINDTNMELISSSGTTDHFFKKYIPKKQALYFLDMQILNDKTAGLN